MKSVRDCTVLEPGAGASIAPGLGRFIPAGTEHAFRNASDRPAWQLVVRPVEVAELIAELGEHPREFKIAREQRRARRS